MSIINLHRVDDLPASPIRGHAYAVATSETTCELWFVNRNGSVIKQVTSTGVSAAMAIDSPNWDASTGSLPANATAGSVYFVGTPGFIDGVYHPVGSMIVALVDNPSDPADWFASADTHVVAGAVTITATADQTTFDIPDPFLNKSLVFGYRGYMINYDADDFVTTSTTLELPNLGFSLEAGEKVTITYLKGVEV